MQAAVAKAVLELETKSDRVIIDQWPCQMQGEGEAR